MMVATRHGGFTVHTGDKLAGMRVIPLVIEKAKMEEAKKAVSTLPADVQAKNPWAKPLRQVQADLK